MSEFTSGGWIQCIKESPNKQEYPNNFRLGEYYQVKGMINGITVETMEGYRLFMKDYGVIAKECIWIGMKNPKDAWYLKYSPDITEEIYEELKKILNKKYGNYERGVFAESFKIESLLKEAYKRYPVGTKYKTAYYSPTNTIETVEKQDFKVINNNHINGEPGKGVLYCNGRWADIIEGELLIKDPTSCADKILKQEIEPLPSEIIVKRDKKRRNIMFSS